MGNLVESYSFWHISITLLHLFASDKASSTYEKSYMQKQLLKLDSNSACDVFICIKESSVCANCVGLPVNEWAHAQQYATVFVSISVLIPIPYTDTVSRYIRSCVRSFVRSFRRSFAGSVHSVVPFDSRYTFHTLTGITHIFRDGHNSTQTWCASVANSVQLNTRFCRTAN